MLQIKKYEGADKEMDENLRMCISTNERDHKKFLQIYKTGTKLDKSGSDLLIFVPSATGNESLFDRTVGCTHKE